MKASLLLSVLFALLSCRPAFGGEIHQAARKGDVEKVRELLVADPKLAKQQCVSIGDFWLNGTPLHFAASSGQKEVVELLLAHKADVNAQSAGTLFTPLHCAAGFGRKEVAELLLLNEAAVDAKDKDKNTPLHLAAGNYPKEVVASLLAKRPEVYEKDSEGKFQLQVVRAWDVGDVIELLLANNADVNARNKQGRTPMHMAAEFGNRSVIELLLSHKADIDAKDRKGRKPVDIALDAQKKIGGTDLPCKEEKTRALDETIEFLRSHGEPTRS